MLVETGKRYLDEADPSSQSPEQQATLLSLARQLSQYADTTVELAKLIPAEHVHYSAMTSYIAPILYSYHEIASELLTALGLDPGLGPEDATLDLLRKGSRSKASQSRYQLGATCYWIAFSEEFDRSRSLEMYGLMLEHLDLAVACGSSLDIRRRELSDDYIFPRDLVSDAVAFAIEKRKIETALSIYRVSSGLEAVAPHLAARFDSLSRQVESATLAGGKGLVDTEANHPFEDAISRAERLRREWENVVEEIRALEGFQRFLRPTPFAELQKAAAEGPVTLTKISKLRSDAIIVLSDRPPTVVPLPEATTDGVRALVNLFRKIVGDKWGNDVCRPLRSLWEEVVEPIISTLETTQDGVSKP
ncbi:hypothetical protein FRB99_007973 [Tulasnella sp. 403]|nr:hypothetical protein FRB99_007973 [Tulasnella sp. 403]